MNVYIFLALILVVSIMFGLKKNSIMEGFAACKDKIPNCKIHKANGGCLDANKDHMSWRTNCVKTCGYCHDPKHNPALLKSNKKNTNKPKKKEIDKFCPANCVKPTKTSGNCATGNPIETKDPTGITKFFRKCSYTCLGPNDKGYKTFDLGVDEKYNVRKHGCRSTEQCGKCGSVKVNRKGKDLWYDLVQVNGSYVEQKKGNIIKRYFVEKPENKLDENKMKKLEEMKKKYGTQNVPGDNTDDKETKKSISSNEQNIADTTKSNMFTDITNASNVGKKDMSLEDYYQRRILNNNTENRLGGSKQALKYLKKMPQDNNGKVSFFNSAWKVFS